MSLSGVARLSKGRMDETGRNGACGMAGTRTAVDLRGFRFSFVFNESCVLRRLTNSRGCRWRIHMRVCLKCCGSVRGMASGYCGILFTMPY
jgi:hypothetical protein